MPVCGVCNRESSNEERCAFCGALRSVPEMAPAAASFKKELIAGRDGESSETEVSFRDADVRFVSQPKVPLVFSSQPDPTPKAFPCTNGERPEDDLFRPAPQPKVRILVCGRPVPEKT